jgi:hypothetical protein
MRPHYSNGDGHENPRELQKHQQTRMMCPICSAAMVSVGTMQRCLRCRFLICDACEGCDTPSICNFRVEGFDSGYTSAYT